MTTSSVEIAQTSSHDNCSRHSPGMASEQGMVNMEGNHQYDVISTSVVVGHTPKFCCSMLWAEHFTFGAAGAYKRLDRKQCTSDFSLRKWVEPPPPTFPTSHVLHGYSFKTFSLLYSLASAPALEIRTEKLGAKVAPNSEKLEATLKSWGPS